MEKLSSQDQHTYDSIFRHPTSGNIEWPSLVALFNHIGEVIDEPNGKKKLVCNGHALMMNPKEKDATLEEIQDIRRLLQKSETQVDQPSIAGGFLLVLDHSEARIYRPEDNDAKPVHIEPYDPHGWDKHVHDTHEYARPHTSALHHEFYEKIANAMKGAGKILVFGSGKGSSEECDQMFEDLKRNHVDVAERIVGKENLDLSHMTEGELLATAREHFAKPEVFLI